MSCEMAQNHINLLSIEYLKGDTYAVMYEWCYTNEAKSKVWTKSILIVEEPKLATKRAIQGIEDTILELVNEQRAELER